MKNVIITGATGMIGNLVLQYCLASDQVGKVTVLSRRTSGVTHDKLTEVLHNDFADLTPVLSHFVDQDVAYFCLGVYTGAVPDAVFKTITVDYPNRFVDALKAANPQATFCLLSGSGADPEEKSRISFARYKGMAENYLLAADFASTHIFRPAYIYPVTPRNEPNFTYRLSRRLYPLIKLFGRNASITSEQLAQAVFSLGLIGKGTQILENKDILQAIGA